MEANNNNDGKIGNNSFENFGEEDDAELKAALDLVLAMENSLKEKWDNFYEKREKVNMLHFVLICNFELYF